MLNGLLRATAAQATSSSLRSPASRLTGKDEVQVIAVEAPLNQILSPLPASASVAGGTVAIVARAETKRRVWFRSGSMPRRTQHKSGSPLTRLCGGEGSGVRGIGPAETGPIDHSNLPRLRPLRAVNPPRTEALSRVDRSRTRSCVAHLRRRGGPRSPGFATSGTVTGLALVVEPTSFRPDCCCN